MSIMTKYIRYTLTFDEGSKPAREFRDAVIKGRCMEDFMHYLLEHLHHHGPKGAPQVSIDYIYEDENIPGVVSDTLVFSTNL